MKGVIFYIAFVFCCLLPVSTVYAGSLNEYEKQVVAEARKTYAYQGKTYQVSEEYIDQLIAYLSQDDVDITAEQRDKALQTAYNNIEKGVLEGYLIPVEDNPQPKTPTPTLAIRPEISEQETDTQSEPPLLAGSDAKEHPTVTNALPDTSESSEGHQVKELSPDEKEEIDRFFGETDHTSIITETGFNFQSTITMIVGIVMLMIIGFIAYCRLDYFAHNDE